METMCDCRRRTALIAARVMVLTVVGGWLAAAVGAQIRTAAPLRLSDAIVGFEFSYAVTTGDSLTGVGTRFGVDASSLARQNQLSLTVRLRPGQQLTVSNLHVVPGGVDSSVIINIPQGLLFVLDPFGGAASAYPVAVGRPEQPTPTGRFRIPLQPDDAGEEFECLDPCDAGEIIYEPVLMAQVRDRVLLEVHRDVYARRLDPLLTVRQVLEQCPIPALDWHKVARVVRDHDGVAHDVTGTPDAASSRR